MSQPNTVPEHVAGQHVHGNYHSAERYEANAGRLDETVGGQQSAADYAAWVGAKSSAPEITEGAGANGV